MAKCNLNSNTEASMVLLPIIHNIYHVQKMDACNDFIHRPKDGPQQLSELEALLLEMELKYEQ